MADYQEQQTEEGYDDAIGYPEDRADGGRWLLVLLTVVLIGLAGYMVFYGVGGVQQHNTVWVTVRGQAVNLWNVRNIRLIYATETEATVIGDPAALARREVALPGLDCGRELRFRLILAFDSVRIPYFDKVVALARDREACQRDRQTLLDEAATAAQRYRSILARVGATY